MTNEERLGTDPLAWMESRDKDPENPTAPETPASEPEAPDSLIKQPGARPACGLDGPPAKDDSLGKRITSPGNVVREEHAMSKSKVKIEQVIETSQVVKHLTDLAKSLENGVIRAEDAENTVILHVPDMMQFEMKVSRKKDKGKCALELTWKDDGTRDEVFKVAEG